MVLCFVVSFKMIYKRLLSLQFTCSKEHFYETIDYRPLIPSILLSRYSDGMLLKTAASPLYCFFLIRTIYVVLSFTNRDISYLRILEPSVVYISKNSTINEQLIKSI
jgi:hypothetical protein